VSGGQHGEREFRPSLETWWRTLLTPAGVTSAVLWLLLVVVQTADGGPGATVLLLLTTLSVGASVVGGQQAVHRVVVTGATVRHRVLPVRTRTIHRSDVARALLLPGYRAVGSVPTGLLVLLDRERRPLVRLDGVRWGRGQLREIALATGAPLDVVDAELRPADLRWRRMYELSWAERHPVVIGLLATGGVVALVVLLGSTSR
jgi:hypothetical protein